MAESRLALRMQAIGFRQTAAELRRVNVAVKEGETGAVTANRAMGGFASGLKSLGTYALATAGIMGAVGLAGAMKEVVDQAEGLEIQLNQTNRVFGRSAGGLKEWAKGVAQTLGLSEQQALKATNSFGTLLKGIGFGIPTAAKMSKRLTGLVADIVSFRHGSVSTDQATQALTRGLLGQTRGLVKIGLAVDANRVKQKAQEMGLYSGKGAIDLLAKSAATYALVLEQTKPQQGDFARRQDSLANSQKRLNAEFSNLSASIGEKVLPYLVKIVNWFNRLVQQFRDGTGWGGRIRRAIGAVGAIIQWTYDRIRDLIKGFKDNKWWALALVDVIVTLTAALAGYRTAVLLAAAATDILAIAGGIAEAAFIPFNLIVLAIALVVVGLVLLYTKCKWVRNAVHNVWDALKTGFEWVKDHWHLLLAILVGPFGIAAYEIVTHWDKVKDLFRGLMGFIKPIFNAVVNFLIDRVNDVLGVINHAIDGYNAAFGWASGNIGKIGPVGHIGGKPTFAQTHHQVAVPKGTVSLLNLANAAPQSIHDAESQSEHGHRITYGGDVYLDGKKVGTVLHHVARKAKATH